MRARIIGACVLALAMSGCQLLVDFDRSRIERPDASSARDGGQIDAAIESDASVDAAMPEDAAIDGGLDAAMIDAAMIDAAMDDAAMIDAAMDDAAMDDAQVGDAGTDAESGDAGLDAGPECVDDDGCDDANPCTDDRCVEGECTSDADDTNACAGGTCREGTCCTGCWTGTTCEAGDVLGACGAAGGACEACADDGNACTDATCTAGACGHRADDTNTCGDGTCHDGACCTGCWNGTSCQAGTSLAACGDDGAACATCSDDANPCTDAACTAGACGQSDDDSNACSDGNPCTDDACDSGACAPVADDSNACAGGTCHVGACCLGCWNGASCEAGTAALACGDDGGACVACTSPPAAFCTGDVATTFPATGSCGSGACSYAPMTMMCADACEGGACIASSALRIASAGERARVSDTADLFPATFTAEMWASFDSFTVTDPMQLLLVAEAPTSDPYRLFYLRAYAGQLGCVIGDGTGFVSAEVPTNVVTEDAMHHFACTRDATTLTLWIDGMSVATTAAPIYAAPSGQVLGIGGDYRTPPEPTASGFRGVVDEVRISSAIEYTATFTPMRRLPITVGTRALWHFDEGSGTSSIDEAHPSAHLAVIDGAMWTAQE